MRSAHLIVALSTLPGMAFAGEIREFDIKTIERLGAELAQVSRQRDRGATSPERKRAKQTAVAALKGKLYDVPYNYVVLADPDGSGFLVYGLATPHDPRDIVLAGHFRVTVSADGNKAERIDALSKTLAIQDGGSNIPVGTDLAGLTMVQIVSPKPLETLVYTNRITGLPIYVATLPHGKEWGIENGKITDTGKFAGKK